MLLNNSPEILHIFIYIIMYYTQNILCIYRCFYIRMGENSNSNFHMMLVYINTGINTTCMIYMKEEKIQQQHHSNKNNIKYMRRYYRYTLRVKKIPYFISNSIFGPVFTLFIVYIFYTILLYKCRVYLCIQKQVCVYILYRIHVFIYILYTLYVYN